MTAQTTLRFARAHDWGQNARLTDDGQITGLIDRYTRREPDGSVSVHEDHVTLPATMAAVRDFGGY